MIGLLLLSGLLCYSSAHQIPRDDYGRIKRSASVIREFKKENPCPSTGERKGACPGYVIDHIKALKRGGCDSTDNLQWQTTEEAKAKDKWE